MASGVGGLAGSKTLKILVIEDDEASRKVLAQALSSLEAEITLAADGEQGVAALVRDHFDVVLTDLRMPGMDGVAVLKTLRQLESRRGGARTPVVVVSAHTREWDLIEAREAGADFHVGKPISIPTLLGLIDSVVEGAAR